MLRDEQPRYNLGYGNSSDSVAQAKGAPDPESGFIAKALYGHPVMRFFATTAATLVAAHVAGSLVQTGGKKLLETVADRSVENAFLSKKLDDFRGIQKILDEFEGVSRTGEGLLSDGPVTTNTGFYLTQAEKDEAAATGFESDAQWTFRNEIQQRLVRQARALPYQLPAAYLAQRAVIDPVFGTNQQDPVKWSNPLDVISDFAQQSVKNTASMLTFEAAVGAGSQAFRQAQALSTTPGTLKPWQNQVRNAFISTDTSLRMLGQRSSDIFYDAAKLGNRFGRSFNAGIEEAIKNTNTYGENVQQSADLIKQSITNRKIDLATAQQITGRLPGFLGQVTPFAQGFGKTWKQVGVEATENEHTLGSFMGVGTGSTAFEKYSLANEDIFGYGDPSKTNLYRTQLQAHYRDYIKNYYANQLGISGKPLDQFMERATFTNPRPRLEGGQYVAPKRSALGNLTFGVDSFEGKGTIEDLIKSRMRDVPGSDAIADNIQKAMNFADRSVANSWVDIHRDLTSQIKSVSETISKNGARTFGQRPLPFDIFGQRPTKEVNDFLINQTAHKLGISLENKTPIQIRNEIAQRGLNPDSPFNLRGFLVQNKVIRPQGASQYNIFGLRKLSAEDALARGYFGGEGTASRGRAEKMLGDISQYNPTPKGMRATTFGPVYENAAGRVFDFATPAQSLRNLRDTVASEYKIPFISLKPFDIFGYNALMKQQHAPSIQYFSSERAGKFMGAGGDPRDALIWTRLKGGRGFVNRIGSTGAISTEAGTYRSFDAATTSFVGRAIRVGAGEPGAVPDNKRVGWRKWFNIDENQPNSVWRWFGRAKTETRQNDLLNPMVLARKLRAGEIDFENTDPALLARGFKNLTNEIRTAGISPSAASHLSTFFGANELSPEQILGANNTEAMRDLLTKIQQNERVRIAETTGGAAKNQSKILDSFVSRHLNRGVDMMQPSTLVNKSATIHRGIDEVKNDLLQYSIISKALQTPGANMDDEFANMMSKLGEMKLAGKISAKEYNETRTALFSTQLNFEQTRSFRMTATSQERYITQLKNLAGIGREPLKTASVLDDIASGRRSGLVGGYIKRRFGTSRAQYPGFRYDPYGGENVLVPTFGTVFNRNPLGALKGLGAKSYNAPENFSGLSIPGIHMGSRINDSLGVLGLKLDEAAYGGPADMFARGLVGKRILPVVAGTAAFMAVDRTVGSEFHRRDAYGHRQYRPLIGGIVARGLATTQVALAGIIPGGETAAQKREEVFHGDVPVRKGRWWILGGQPWKGGNEEYYRPSWYRRFMSGYQYNKEYGYKSPLEKLAFGYDFSPLRPLDPYRFERETYNTRPYPVTGDYFSGPWGPLTPILNSTVGKLLKPRVMMHKQEMANAMVYGFLPSGQYGATTVSSDNLSGGLAVASNNRYERAGAIQNQTARNLSQSQIQAYNAGSIDGRGASYAAGKMTKASLQGLNERHASNAVYRATGNVIPNQPAIVGGSLGLQASEAGYRTQEMLGIYGFTFGAARSAVGLGNQNLVPSRPVLQSADLAYGSSRSFWDQNLGGAGDVQMPFNGMSNFELSEIVRRFVPRPRRLNTINPLTNDLGKMYPWLPDARDVRDYHHGDPFSLIPEGEMRLPGPAYEQFHNLHSDKTGKYGMIDKYAILGDIAPWSNQFQSMKKQMVASGLSNDPTVQQTTERADSVLQEHDFYPYQYPKASLGGAIEWLQHRDTWINRKFFPYRTATEDWERNHVYGTQYAEWQHPVRDFLKPMVYKSTTRNPFTSAVGLSAVGMLFGDSPRARATGAFVGAGVGFIAGLMQGSGDITGGQRFIPEDRRKELAVEEDVDLLSYMKARRQYEIAQSTGDKLTASMAAGAMQRTEYGVDVYHATPDQLALAVPKNKREHFLAMLEAPKSDRGRILSTAGRLERRLYEGYWGEKIEQRPDLVDYFSEHELPAPDSEFWTNPETMDDIKIKMLQRLDLDPKHVGFYPQEIQRANLRNPVYPEFQARNDPRNVEAQIRQLLNARGIQGNVTRSMTPYANNQIVLNQGIY